MTDAVSVAAARSPAAAIGAGTRCVCAASNSLAVAPFRFSPAAFGQPVGEIDRCQLVQAHALRCGACRQPLVQALGDSLHELAAVSLGAGNAPRSCCSAAAHALKASCARRWLLRWTPRRPRRRAGRERSPESRLPRGEAARCEWRSHPVSLRCLAHPHRCSSRALAATSSSAS